MYVVDNVLIAQSDLPAYLDSLERQLVPAARQRGMDLLAAWHTSAELGEDVTVTTIFRLQDWAHWVELRARAALDPKLYEWLAAFAPMRKGGRRLFYQRAGFSPL
ncbi:hypothetical protein [Mycobacterium avium]|uniref:hypothetical protein n=1 Tax=Mycobacterium avium TaxID=1764 RepID=UPI0012DA800D|nr:hypothetical protein [Mycobacterium avium]